MRASVRRRSLRWSPVRVHDERFCVGRVCGVVVEDIDPAVPGGRVCHPLVDASFVSCINQSHVDRQSMGRRQFCRSSDPSLTYVARNHGGTGTGKQKRHFLTLPSSRTGYQCDFSGKATPNGARAEAIKCHVKGRKLQRASSHSLQCSCVGLPLSRILSSLRRFLKTSYLDARLQRYLVF